ncbi:MAG TPA: tetratricopeptide repeat protein, partial [Kofleriaceae bacterium]|nr:tetratricopeptide repeat protein [Kofleriaceae bacterium]
VQRSAGGRLVAIELRTRLGGKLTDDVMVFQLSAVAAPPGAAPPAPAAPASSVRSKAMEATLKAGWKQSRARKHAAAEKTFREALALDAGDPEAHYGVAVSLAGQKKLPAAVAELQAMAALVHPETIVWQVEARMDPVFKPLLTDAAFRKAVGLDAPIGASTYEKLVGRGGKWEQPLAACDKPKVNLNLSRRPRTFDLVVKNSCQGSSDTTKLDGTWTIDASGQMVLTFPNPGEDDEAIPCTLAVCADGSGEDCMACGAGTDFEMHLRTVQR